YPDRPGRSVIGVDALGGVYGIARPREGTRHDRTVAHDTRRQLGADHCESWADLSSAGFRYWVGARRSAVGFRGADAWKPRVVLPVGLAVCDLRHRPGNDDCDLYADATAGAVDGLLYKPSTGHSFRS